MMQAGKKNFLSGLYLAGLILKNEASWLLPPEGMSRLARPYLLASGKLPLCEAKDMHKQRLMHVGDAAVRLVWKLLWSWRR